MPGHHQSSHIRKGSQSSKQTAATLQAGILGQHGNTSSHQQRMGFQSGANNLLMQNDINTQGHTQWFYFRIMNTRKGQTVKFNILNYSKPDSLFNYGMKVSMYSEKKAEHEQVGWFKGGKNIGYTLN